MGESTASGEGTPSLPGGAIGISESIGHVKFTEDEARVTMVQIAESCESSDGKYAYKLASQQCIEQLLAHPPATFHAEFKGTNLEPHLHVSVSYTHLTLPTTPYV